MKKTTRPIKTFQLDDLRRLTNDELPKVTGGGGSQTEPQKTIR